VVTKLVLGYRRWLSNGGGTGRSCWSSGTRRDGWTRVGLLRFRFIIKSIFQVVFVRVDKIEVASRKIWVEEEIVSHDNNMNRGAVGVHGLVECSFEVCMKPKAFELLGDGGDKFVEHFVKEHGDPIGITNGVGFQTNLNVLDELGVEVVVEKVAFEEAVKVLGVVAAVVAQTQVLKRDMETFDRRIVDGCRHHGNV
jgi:hypothetical protein